MRNEFVESVLTNLLTQGLLDKTDKILTVCSGQPEMEIFQSLGFHNVTISNLDPRCSADDFKPYQWSSQNALSLTFGDSEFDFAFVSDGLHHCSSPHRALLEMYRVSKKGVLVVESRDSLLMRWAVSLGITAEYEVGSVEYHSYEYGGVDNTDIPNYIYRWTEREFEKTVQSYDPVGKHHFIFEYGFRLPVVSARFGIMQIVINAMLAFLSFVIPLIAKRQGNSFAMIALRPDIPDDLWPWLQCSNGQVRARRVGRRED
jgi:SAM-dependent methyltransferase